LFWIRMLLNLDVFVKFHFFVEIGMNFLWMLKGTYVHSSRFCMKLVWICVGFVKTLWYIIISFLHIILWIL
jgi:hypothetical protein